MKNYTRYDEIDIKILIRAAMHYYQRLNDHINGTESLSKEMITYSANKLLELTLMIEEMAAEVYGKLPEEDKQILELAEKKRNEGMFAQSDGDALSEQALQTLYSVLDTIKKREDDVRNKSTDRINNLS